MNMVSYEKTIERFLAEVELYLTRRMEAAKNKAEAKEIQKTRFQWGMIKSAPKKYINEQYDYINMLSAEGFKCGNDNYSVYQAATGVLNTIRNLYIDAERGFRHLQAQHQIEFENAYKYWKYKSSSNLLKDFTFPFRSAKSFLVRVAKEENIK